MPSRPDAPRDVAVVVPGAGSGSRLGGVPKQFRDLGGRWLLCRTVEALCGIHEVRTVVVAVPPDWVKTSRAVLAEIDAEKLIVVAGGGSRQESVCRGLARLQPPVEIVLVHDAARPFVSPAEILGVINATRSDGAAAVAVPVADTLRAVDGDVFGRTISREGVYRMQTPQGFRLERLVAAHEWANETGWTGTDDVELVTAHAGVSVALVPGKTSNFKITSSEDWRMAQHFWPLWQSGA